MFSDLFLRRWPYEFDVFESERDFDKKFYQELEILRQNHWKRMRDISFFRPKYFEKIDYFYQKSKYFNDFDRLHNFQTYISPEDNFSIRYSKMNPRESENHRIRVDCKGYSVDSITVTISEDKQSIIISGQEGNNYEKYGDYSFKQFRKVFRIPTNANVNNITQYWELDGYLVLDIPLNLNTKLDSKKYEANKINKRVQFDDNKKIVKFEEKPLHYDDEKCLVKIINQKFKKEVTVKEYVYDEPFRNPDDIFRSKIIRNEKPDIAFNEEISFSIPIKYMD